MNFGNPFWIAQREGHDWRDADSLRAINWLTSSLPPAKWQTRLEAVKARFEAAKQEWAAGNHGAELFDPKDMIAWYVFQANAYSQERHDWFEPEAFRISPVFRRLGMLVPELDQIDGAKDRALTLMTNGRRQPDDGLFELLVAGAYRRRSWDVAFVPEQPGIAKTPDLLVSSGRRRWAVECKRMNQSGYDGQERAKGAAMARQVHDLCQARSVSLVLEVAFKVELTTLSESYLLEKAQAYLSTGILHRWSDGQSQGVVRPVNWHLTQTVLSQDDVFFGSSRMVELLASVYRPDFVHSVQGDWISAPARPLHATSMDMASLVSWRSDSHEAAMRRARHFRSLVGRAADQLPGDRPGVVHVGCESLGGSSVDGLRHFFNTIEMRQFDPEASRLRWVYGHYLAAEHTNDRNESDALNETTASYKISQHGTAQPLPHHMLFGDGDGRPGTHW